MLLRRYKLYRYFCPHCMQQPEALYQSFQQSFFRFYEPLCQYAFTLVKEEAACEDIVQDIFMRIWEKKQDLIGKQELQYYLYTAVRNNCLTFLEKQRKNPTAHLLTDDIPDEEAVRPGEQVPETDLTGLLKHAFEQLPPKCREVFALSRLNGLSYQQISEVLGISIKTVENQVGKALKILRAYWQQQQAPIWLPWLFFSLFYTLCVGAKHYFLFC
jgi:RNA polymerase sigma-70 factor (family 1)